MSRKDKNGNIKQQLQRKIDDMTRFGEKKIKNDPTNSNRCDGIHSIKTCESYRATARLFGDYLKQEGVRNIGDITREHVDGFMQSRSSMSPYTYSRELSAINKMLDTRYTVRDFGLSHRSYKDIQNNRGLAQRDTSDALRNRQQLDFVRACGMRRESIDRITPGDFIRDQNGQCIGVHLLEKGGRERISIIIEQDRQKITEQVNQAIERNGEHVAMFKQVDSNANPHYERAEYAQRLYADLVQAQAQQYDYYQGMRNTFINEQAHERACARYHNEIVRGFDRDIMADVSQALGHNRIDVVLYHYLKA